MTVTVTVTHTPTAETHRCQTCATEWRFIVVGEDRWNADEISEHLALHRCAEGVTVERVEDIRDFARSFGLVRTTPRDSSENVTTVAVQVAYAAGFDVGLLSAACGFGLRDEDWHDVIQSAHLLAMRKAKPDSERAAHLARIVAGGMRPAAAAFRPEHARMAIELVEEAIENETEPYEPVSTTGAKLLLAEFAAEACSPV